MADYTVTDRSELDRGDPTSELQGHQIGAGVSIILVDMPPGAGVRLHRHPYEEVFVVEEGTATYRVGSATLAVRAGQILTVSAGVAHAFTNTGEGRLRQVDIHLSERFVTEWLE